MRSVRSALLVVLVVLGLELLVASVVAPLVPWLVVALVLTGIFGAAIRRNG